MKLWRFEGSPDEFRAIASSLMGDEVTVVKEEVPEIDTPVEQKIVKEKNRERRFVTVEEAKEVLTRRPISSSMANILRAVLEAGEGRVGGNDLRDLNAHSLEQFRGVMGAFGNRLVHTVGTDKWFFDDEWDFINHQNTYKFPPSVRQALDELDIL